jgi:uncharacterized protein (DUF58 family)
MTGVYVSLDELAALEGRARGFSFLPRQPVRSLLAGRLASRLRGRGLNFEEIRPYQPGDDVRQIDWKVTARTRRTHSRIYTEERERPLWLVVDQRAGMFFGSRVRMKSVTAAHAAALAAWRTLAAKDRVGGVVFSDEVTVYRPHRSRSAVLRLLGGVVEKNAALRRETKPAPGMLNEALRRVAQLAAHDCLVVLITDGDGADDQTRELVTTIARHNDVVGAFVFDPLEADLPAGRSLAVTDGERQLTAEVSSSLAAGFRSQQQDRRERMGQFLRSRQIPILSLDTVDDVAAQVVRQLGGRRV